MTDAPDHIGSEAPPKRADADLLAGLFVDDETLHRKIAPYLGEERFKAMVADWETRGFPKKLKRERGRYWPACMAWIDGEYGVRGNDSPGKPKDDRADGTEDFDAAPGRKARLQAGPQSRGSAARPAVLDGEPDPGPRPGGVSRTLRPIAGGRDG